MNRKLIAGMIAAVTIGAAAGSATVFLADQDTQLQIAEGAESEAAESEAAEPEAAESESSESFTEAASEMPKGDISKAELIGDSGEISYSGVADVAANVMPAMVSITNTSVQEVRDWFRGQNFQYESHALGTGVIMGENEDELLVVTNDHVVENASELTVSFIDEESVSAIVKGTDADNDLAVVAVQLSDIPKETLDVIRVANVADSDEVKVGEQVIAIGNALGYGQSVTTGIVSALGRTVKVQDIYSVRNYDELIQTDAAINQGNSGGALLNMKGEVIGINSVKAGASGVEGMGYAIPTSKAIPIVQHLMNRETREKTGEDELPYLGITGQDVTSNVASVYGLPEGIYIAEVAENTPASEAGLKQGMIIVKFDGETVHSMVELQDLLSYYKAGEEIAVTVAQQNGEGGYEDTEITVTLGLRSDYTS